ncbi:MAG: hypothetical protein ACRELX_05855 [Longimicrobiales bacterium]
MNLLVPALLLQLQAATVPPDSVEAIRKAARRAEAEFERLARRLAPVDHAAWSGSDCDEIVGRFCLRYDTGRPPEPKPEPDRVTLARRLAIEALRRAFTFQADELATSGPLVRYLVEDDRAPEAVAAARTYAALTGDTIWGPLLLGFALHATGEDTTAERLFDAGLGRLPADERERYLDVEWLLSNDDRKRYDDLTPEERRRFERTLWRLSDPLFLTPGNERRAEHLARHVWSRLHERAPFVTGMVRWGDDLDQLTARYGVPYARSRTAGTMTREGSLIEHFDPDQLAYVPEHLLSRGPPPTPLPGETWPLENPRTRSGYAPRTIRVLRELPHQVSVFPDGDSVIVRIDAEFALDSVATGRTAATIALFLADEAGEMVAAVRDTARVRDDTATFVLELPAAPGSYVYSAEVLEPETGQSARARYAVDVPARDADIALSDPVLARPFGTDSLPADRGDGRLRPLTSLVLAPGDTVGLYAEVHGLATGAGGESAFRVQLTMRRADRASLPARLVSWLGQRLGLSSPDTPPRLAWSAHGPAGAPAMIAVDLQLEDDDGLYVIVLEVTDEVTGAVAESRKVLRVGES